MLKKLSPALAFILFLPLALASIWQALNGPFLFDDFNNLGHLQQINGDLTLRSIGNYLAAYTGSPGRPISAISFLINDYAWPSEAFSFKYTNAMIHLCNGLLVYWLLHLLPKVENKLPTSAYWPAAIAAIWIIHPLQLSAQMLVVQRMTLLSSMFILLGFIAYLKMLPKVRSLSSAFILSATLGVFTILAFLCKENGILLPVYILVLNMTLLRQDIGSLEAKPRFLLTTTAIVPSLLIVSAVMYLGLQEKAYAIRDFNAYERLLTQAHVIGDYLKAIALPRLSGSGIYFDDYPITRSLHSSPSTALIILAIVILNLAAWVKRKTWPIFSFAIFWYFGGHLIESTIIPLELYFEHRNYLPILAPVIFITTLAFNSHRKRTVWLSSLAAWFLMLILITHMQARVWGDVRLLSTIWAEERPSSVRAIQQKAIFFESIGMPDEAFKILYENHKTASNSADLILGSLTLACGKPVTLKNINLYQETLTELEKSKFSHGVTSTLSDLGNMVHNDSCPSLVSKQRWLAMSQALLDNPRYAKFGRGPMHVTRANFFNAGNMPVQTILELKEAYAFKPSVESARDVGYAYLISGNKADALKWLKIAVSTKQPLFEEMVSSNKDDIKKVIDTIKKENR